MLLELAPQWRGKGIGRKLLQHGMDMFLSDNKVIKNIEAIIKIGNNISEHIFRQCGFNNKISANVKGFFKLTYRKYGTVAEDIFRIGKS